MHLVVFLRPHGFNCRLSVYLVLAEMEVVSIYFTSLTFVVLTSVSLWFYCLQGLPRDPIPPLPAAVRGAEGAHEPPRTRSASKRRKPRHCPFSDCEDSDSN